MMSGTGTNCGHGQAAVLALGAGCERVPSNGTSRSRPKYARFWLMPLLANLSPLLTY